MSSDAVQQVRACLKDEDHYKKGRKKIIQQIDNGNRLYTTALVDTVKAVLKDKKEPGVSKFIALYFLKEAMDTKDPELVNYVKEKTLSRLSEIAKSDTSKIFPSKTEDKILRNFDQLLLECIVFWAEWFGAEKGGSKYKSTLAEVKQKVELPKKYSFFVTKKKKEDAPPDSGKPAAPEPTKKEESKQSSSKPAGKKEPVIAKIQELLSTQEGNKEMLMESIAGSNKPDINVLQIVNDQFIDIDKELQEAVNVLFPMEFPEKEGILNRVLEETSFTSKYLNDFKRLQKKQMSLDEFKSSMLVAIGGTKGQNKGKEAPKTAKTDPPKPAASKNDFNVDFNQGQNTGNLYGGGQQNAFGGFETAPQPGRGSNAFENFGGSSATRPSQVNQDFNNFGGQQNAFGNFDSAPPSANQQQQQGGGFGAFDDPRQANQGNNAFGNFDNPQQQNFGDFNNFGGGNQRQGRPNVVPPPNDFNQQQNFNDNSASASNRRRSKDTPFDHDQGFDNHNQGGNQGFNNNQGFDNRGQGAFDTPFDQDQGHHDNRGHGGSQAFDNSNQGRGGAQDFSDFGSGWDPNPNEKVKGAGNKGQENNQGFDQHNQGHGGGNQEFGDFGGGWDNNPNQGFDQNQGFNDNKGGRGGNQGFDNNQSRGGNNQGFDQNQGFNDNRGGRGGNQGFDNNQSRGGNNQGFDQGWDNNNQGFDNNQQGFSDNRDNRRNQNQNANQGFDNSNQGWDNNNQGFDNSQGFNENRRGAGNKQPENNQGFDNSQQEFGDSRDNRDNRRNQNQNANQGFDSSNQGWDNSNQGFDQSQGFNDNRGGRGGNQGFDNNQSRGGNNQGFDQGWDNQNQGFNDNRGGRGGNQGFDSNQGRGGNNQGFDSNQGRGGNNQGFDQGWDNHNQGFDNNHENGQVPFQNTPVIEVSESLRGIRGKAKEEKKPAANNFDDMWDSGNLEVPPPQKNDGGIGFDDFGDFNSATHGGSAFDSYNNNQQQQQQQYQQQQQQASRNQSQGNQNQNQNQRSEFGDAFEWGAPQQPERKPYQSPPTGSFNNEFNNDFNNDYRQQQQQQNQSQSQYQQDQRYPQQQNDNQFEAPKRFDSFGGESQQVPQRFGNETRFDNFNRPEVRSQNYGSDNRSPSMSNLNQNFAPPPSNFNNEPRRDFPQRHDFTQDLTGGYGNSQFKNERPPIRNEVTPPTMYSQSIGGVSNSGFNMGRSMDTHSNYNTLSTNTLVAQNAIPAKMGDMESERLRRERDKILSELDNVKRLYNGLKVEHDHMKMNTHVVGGDFNRLKYEVDDLKRTQGELAMNSQQLRMENEGFRHQRGAMTSENAGHMRLFEDMSREIAQLKGKLTDHDFNDRRRKNEAHVMNLETSLKNAQFQVDSMQTLHHRVANEYNKANSELDKLKLGHYVPAQTNLPSNLIPQIQATAQSIGRPSFSPPRARSRSPGMDLMNIIGDPMPRYSNPTRTSVVNSVVGLRYSPTRSDVDRRMDYASGNVLYSSPPRAEPEVVNTRMSPPRIPESLYGPNVDRTVPPLFSKYTNQTQSNQAINQPIGLHDIQIQQIQAPLYDLSRLPAIPDKYTRTSVTPMYPAEQGYTFQAPTGPLGAITAIGIGGREGNLAKSTLINPNPVPTNTNPANRKANDLIEKAKRLRESASRGDSFRSGRESVNVRTSIPANEGRYFAENPSSVYQTAVKTSPKRYSPGRGNFGSGLNMDDLRKQSNLNRSPPSLMVSHTKMGGLPQGLYRGSPVRERIVNREEVIELKPTESLKIVERPVRSSPNRVRGKSPGPIAKAKSDENIAIGQNAVSLAQTLKNDIQMFKRGMRGSPEAATINPNRNNQYEQEGGLIANKYHYNKGTSVESTLQGVTISANDFGRRNEMLSDNEEAQIRQVSGVPGVKLTVGDNYFQGATTTPKKYFQEPIPVRESGPEGVTQYNVAGKKVRGKQGKMMIYDHGMFDQFTNTIYGYTHYRDVDAYKSACLTSRATLFDSPNLQITVITKNENDEVLKAIIYFTNKSNNDISEFSSYPMDTSVQSNPIVQGATLAPKYQLKQELFIHFMDFREMPYILDISYKHENSSKQMNLALPITINKFMKFRHGVERNTFKGAWKKLKTRAVTTGYRNINAKFVRNPVEIKKYFDNNLLDVTPHLNPKHKKKYGGIFVLPDNREYYVKFTMDTSRIKILASSGRDEPGYEEWVAQYLSFLLTV